MAPCFVSCKNCSRHFNTDIKEGFVCCLCTALDRCTSDIDRQVLEKSDQCRICGNFYRYGRLDGPICDRCVQFAVDERWSLADIPAATKTATGFDDKFKKICQAMMLPPPLPPPPPPPVSAAATQVLVSAREYQNNASTFRLGNTVTASLSNRNLPKVNSILKERHHVRTLAQKSDRMIAVIASLWRVEGSSKERAVNNTSVKARFSETEFCSKVVSDLFDCIKDSLSCGPTPELIYLGKCIELTSITIGAIAGKGTHYLLMWDSFVDSQLIKLFDHFHRHEYLPKASQDNRTVTLAFKFDAELYGEYEELKSMSVISSRPSRRPGQSSVPQKRGRSETISSTTPAPLAPRLPSLAARLFRPSIPAAPRFSRDPPLVEVYFYRILVRITDDFGIIFDRDEILDEDPLFLASLASSEDPKLAKTNSENRKILQTSGWIGEGQSKIARYCRLKNSEFAFSQVSHRPKFGGVFTNDDNTNMIEHEVGLHYLAAQVKTVFDETLVKHGVFGAPDFYFAPDAIYGQVNRSKLKDEAEVPFENFVAYPLLPTGPDGGTLHKFTGSDSLGEQPSELLSLEIHAFAHFSLHYLRGSLVFTDLQGLRDKAGKMCLFDVQAHTDRLGFNVFFNRGKEGIKNFLHQHKPMCPQNPFCQKLGLKPE